MKRRSLLKLIPLPAATLLPLNALADMRKRVAESFAVPPMNLQPRMTATEMNRLNEAWVKAFEENVREIGQQATAKLSAKMQRMVE